MITPARYHQPTAVIVLIVVCLATLTGYAIGAKRNGRVKQVNVPLGFIITDGENRPIRPASGIRIVVFKVGRRAWHQDLWTEIRGQPDDQGYVWSSARFPIDTTIVHNLNQLVQ